MKIIPKSQEPTNAAPLMVNLCYHGFTEKKKLERCSTHNPPSPTFCRLALGHLQLGQPLGMLAAFFRAVGDVNSVGGNLSHEPLKYECVANFVFHATEVQ